MSKLIKSIEKPNSRYLVFTSAGENNNIKRWLEGKEFDLWVTCYSETARDELLAYADYFNFREGGKFPNFHFIAKEFPELLRQYDAIYVSDDDILISGKEINLLFEYRQRYDLWVLQPAFDRRGKISHSITRGRLFSDFRYSSFVEVTCPLFKTDKLLEFMGQFDPSIICWGVDYWYCWYFAQYQEKQKIAIIDRVLCTNPHDIFKRGGREIMRLQTDQERVDTWKRIKNKYQIGQIEKRVEGMKSTFSIARLYRFAQMYIGLVIRKSLNINNQL